MSDEYELGEVVAAPKAVESDYELGETFVGNPQNKPSAAFQDRVDQGSRLYKALGSIGSDIKEGFGQDQLGFSPESEAELRKAGIWHDPSTGRGGPIRFMNEAVMKPVASAADFVFRAVAAGVHGVGGIAEQLALADGQSQGSAQRAKNEVINLGNYAMMRGDMNFARAERPVNIEKPKDQGIGALPKPEDFQNAATVLTEGEPNANIQNKLYKLYNERGIHPAEVLEDIKTNPTLHQELLSDNPHLPEPYGGFTALDGLPTDKVAGDMWLLTRNDVGPKRTQAALPGEIATRVMPDGRVVPAPDAIVGYLKDFGKEAGFTFTVSPAMKTPRDQPAPWYDRFYSRDVNTGAIKQQSSVHIPESGDELYRRWFGLDTGAILYHEVGHALDDLVLKREGGITGKLDPAIAAEAEIASRAFKPELWKTQPGYNLTPAELMADAVAQWISNPEMRSRMPEFTAKYGERLTPYLEMANKYLPKKSEGKWEQPETEAGRGSGGNGGGGGSPPGGPEPVFEHEPYMIEHKMSEADAKASILGHLSVDKIADTSRKWTWDRFYTNMVDKFHPIAQAVKESGMEFATKDDPYKLARLFAGWGGKATHFLEKGTFDYNNPAKNLGPALKDILAPFKGDLDGFRAFVTAARAKELELAGKATGFNPKAIMSYVTPENIAKYAPAMEKLVNYQNQLSAYLRDSGVISPKMYDAMTEANRLFVPFHVAIDHANIGIEAVGKTMQAYNPIKKIKGSDAPKIDPLESIVRNTYLLTSMAEKNNVASKLIDMLLGGKPKDTLMIEGGPRRLPKPETKEVGKYLGDEGMNAKQAKDLSEMFEDFAHKDLDGEVSRYVEGRRETYRVDSDLARAVKGLDSETIGMIEKLMKPFASTLRAGAVLTPDFMIRHTFRDYLYAVVTTAKGVFTPVDMVKGLVGYATKDASYWEWQKSGGGHVSMVHLDRNYLQEDLHRLTDQTGLFTRSWNVVVDPASSFVDKGGAVLGLPFKAAGRYVLHPLQMGTELVISASHLGAYKKARYLEDKPGATKANLLDAAWVSRDVSVDGARIGANMKAYNMISAFANNKIQDTDRIVRALKDDPMGAGLKIMMSVTLPSLLLWSANKDKSWYKETPRWEKDIFWHIHVDNWQDATEAQVSQRMSAAPDQVRQVNGKYQIENGWTMRLPKPFGMGVIFGTGAERMAEQFIAHNPEGFKHFFAAIQDATVGELTPNMLAPIIDQAQNRVSFTGRTLVPTQTEKLLPEYQYTEYTSELTKAIGKMVSSMPGMGDRADRGSTGMGGVQRAVSSPILIENYVRGWAGGLGQYALNAADLSLRKAGILPDVPKAASTLADIPVVRAFISRYPTANTQSIQDFYDTFDKNKTFYDTWKAKADEGDGDAMARISAMGGPKMMIQLDGIKQALNSQSQLLHNINKNPQITPAEKRQLIDGIYYGMISVGKQGIDAMRDIDKILGK